MIGYPITYGDTLEEVNSFTSEMFITEISEYWSNEKNKINFNKGYKLGLLVFGIGGLVLISRPAFASDSGVLPNNNGAGGGGSCPETGPTQSGTPAPGPGNTGSLAKVPTADRGAFGASALGICGIAMKSGAYWIGFVCAAAVIVGVRMAAIPADQAL
nr:hypothetical protein [Haslea ostrearia]